MPKMDGKIKTRQFVTEAFGGQMLLVYSLKKLSQIKHKRVFINTQTKSLHKQTKVFTHTNTHEF